MALASIMTSLKLPKCKLTVVHRPMVATLTIYKSTILAASAGERELVAGDKQHKVLVAVMRTDWTVERWGVGPMFSIIITIICLRLVPGWRK